MIESKKLMFVHIPRTAGTTINNIFDIPSCARFPYLHGHDPYFMLANLNDVNEYHTFTVVRNPYTRAFSHYRAFCANLTLYNTKVQDYNFTDFLKYVRAKGNASYSHITFNRSSFAIYDQCFFIQDNFAEIKIDKIYRYENLKELENDFNVKMERVFCHNPHFHKITSNYTKDDYLKAYTKQNINLVKNLYYRDFCILNYSFEFEES